MVTLLNLAQGGQVGSPLGGGILIPMALVFLVWWFLLIRPQRRQEARHREMLGSLKSGDRVVTTGGLMGTISQVQDKTVKLRIADNVKVEVLRSAIASKQPESTPGDSA